MPAPFSVDPRQRMIAAYQAKEGSQDLPVRTLTLPGLELTALKPKPLLGQTA